ncbi:MAG TPA: hypothetical protein VF911_19055 [Thermoanaerobaculia bacterium]
MDQEHLKTAQALQRITDRGKFELLVADILWIAEPRYRSLITTGVNAEGEPVRGVVDGVARVSGTTPPEFLLLAVTTTNVRDLERKFIDDLTKAAATADALRTTAAKAPVTLIFATNEVISAELVTRMFSQTAARSLDLDLWDQRRLARVLDLLPEGQWLRQRYLGLVASALSANLLQSLSKTSIGAYSASLLSEPGELPERKVVADIIEVLGNDDTTLLTIAGESGFGKSTAALQALTRCMEAGDAALWATADHVAAAPSVDVLLTNVLTEIHGSGIDDVLPFLRESETTGRRRPRVLIAVDDLNRMDAGSTLVRKVVQWSAMLSRARGTMPRIAFILPLWPGIHMTAAVEHRNASWWNTVDVSRFTRAETIEALGVAGVPSATIDAVAEELADDPFLVGRFRAVAAERRAGADHIALARTVLDIHLGDIERELAGTTPLTDAAIVHRTLIGLARNEIEHAALQPTIDEVRKWLPDALPVLDAALRSGRLLVRRYARDGDEIHFRHDRLHDQLLGSAMAEIIGEEPNHVAIRDPFFARVTGIALTTIDDARVDRVATEAPLAVFESLRTLGNRATSRRQKLFEIAAQWADHHAAAVPPQVRVHVLTALLDADSSLVLRLTEAFPDRWLRRLVRLRAGDAASGAAFCAESDSGFIFQDSRVRRATEHAMMFHREMLVSGTAELLRSAADDQSRYGALTLAGFSGAPELARGSLACWQGAHDRDAVMPAAMWAAIRCAKGDDVEIFSPLLDQILLPEAEGTKTRRNDVFYAAGSYSRFASVDAIEALDREAHKDPRRARVVLALLQYTDDPTVFGLVLRVAAARTGEGFDLLTLRLRSDWSQQSKRSRRPGPASRKVLENAWRDEALSATVRWEAFELWSTSAADNDLESLRTTGKESPFHEAALRARARMGDQTVAAELAEHISRPDYRGIYDLWSAPSVWSPELYGAIDVLLRRVEDHMDKREDCTCDVHGLIADLLVKISPADAEGLLLEHWSSLGRNRRFIQVALFIGTQRLVTLATTAVNARPNDTKVFEGVGFRFLAFHTDEDGVLTPEHLSRLLPFSSRIPSEELSKIIGDAARRGWRQWIIDSFEIATAHLPAVERDRLRASYLPETKQLSAEFRRDAARAFQWAYDLEQRAIPAEQIVDAVVLAVAEPAVDNELWAAACDMLVRYGHRPDIVRFERYVPATPEAKAAFVGSAFEVRHRSLR